MKRIPKSLLLRMADHLTPEDRDGMAIPSYTHPNPLLRWMAWKRVEVVVRRLERVCRDRGSTPHNVVMDFGCGTGVMFDEAGRWAERVYGVDPVLAAAEILIGEWGLEKVTLLGPEEARGEIPDHSVDVIVAAEVLEHIDPLDETLDFFRRCLKPDGVLIVSVPTENAIYRLGRRLAGFDGHYHRQDAASVHGDILRFGFERRWIWKVPAREPLAIFWILDYRLS